MKDCTTCLFLTLASVDGRFVHLNVVVNFTASSFARMSGVTHEESDSVRFGRNCNFLLFFPIWNSSSPSISFKTNEKETHPLIPVHFASLSKTWYVLPQNWSQKRPHTSIPSKTENWIYVGIEYLKSRTLLYQK